MVAELVANDDAMVQVLWTRHLLVAQGEYVLGSCTCHDEMNDIIILNSNCLDFQREGHVLYKNMV